MLHECMMFSKNEYKYYIKEHIISDLCRGCLEIPEHSFCNIQLVRAKFSINLHSRDGEVDSPLRKWPGYRLCRQSTPEPVIRTLATAVLWMTNPMPKVVSKLLPGPVSICVFIRMEM